MARPSQLDADVLMKFDFNFLKSRYDDELTASAGALVHAQIVD